MCKNISTIKHSPSTNQVEQTKFFLKQAFLIMKRSCICPVCYDRIFVLKGDFESQIK